MAPFIPEAKLLEIKDAASIAEVIGQYVSLKPRGRYLVGLCPFHAEKTPSFTVNPERNIFHCFGCGAGGSVFSFLMQHQRMTFPEAVAELAQRYGIPLQWKKDPAQAQVHRRRQALYDVTEQAALFFEKNLRHRQRGEPARTYLARRGLPEETAAAYRLGYAPDDWRLLGRALSDQGADLEAAQQVGLIAPRSTGGHYDRFRGRLIFPIFDLQGRVIAFGGRVIGAGEPKYLNSPENQLYSKGRHLYGLYQAREAVRQRNIVILVEGYMDLLALRARGIEPVAASLGTALTREQVRLLKGYTSRVVLVFDADAAGMKAMQHSLPHFAGERLPVRVLTLPRGEDPDSYAAKHGVEIFRSPWEQATPLFTFILDQASAGGGEGFEAKIAAFDSLKPYFQGDLDPVERTLWLQLAAKRLGLPESVLEASLQTHKHPVADIPTPIREESLNLEKKFIRLLLTYPEVLSRIDLEHYLNQFSSPEMHTIGRYIHACYREVGYLDHSLLVTQIEEEHLCRQICSLALCPEEIQLENLDSFLEDCTRGFQKVQLKKQLHQIIEKIHLSYNNDKGGDYLSLYAQRIEIQQRLKKLDKWYQPWGEKEKIDGQGSNI
ncbi:MAG: DNA primase [Deltaproteobacteria bacterium]|nr:DNA primase [Deltaproteobacteria bacterium]